MKAVANQLLEVQVVDAHGVALVAQHRLFLVQDELDGRQARARQREQHWVAPHLPRLRQVHVRLQIYQQTTVQQ